MQLNIKQVSLAFGISWALGVLLLGWASAVFGGWAGQVVTVLASAYLGYGASFVGGILGGIWGLVDGLVCGAIFAYIFNRVKK